MCNSERIRGERATLSSNELKELKPAFSRSLRSHQKDVCIKAGDSPVSSAAVLLHSDVLFPPIYSFQISMNRR